MSLLSLLLLLFAYVTVRCWPMSSLGAYERLRQSNMKRNADVLESLGLANSPAAATGASAVQKKRPRKEPTSGGAPRSSPRLSSPPTLPAESLAAVTIQPAPAPASRPARAESARTPTAVEDEAYDALRDHRQTVAREEGGARTNASQICQWIKNRTLREMVSRLPADADELAKIFGMGSTKVEHYGEGLLRALQPWRAQLPALKSPHPIHASSVRSSMQPLPGMRRLFLRLLHLAVPLAPVAMPPTAAPVARCDVWVGRVHHGPRPGTPAWAAAGRPGAARDAAPARGQLCRNSQRDG